MNIEILFRDGTKKEFLHKGRPGGSYTKEIRYEGNFAIVKDEWHNETAIPMDLIKEIQTSDTRY